MRCWTAPLLALALAFATLAPAHAEEVTGIAKAIDADTLDIEGGPRLRLYGIDAPEIAQKCKRSDGREWRCGVVARDRLSDLIDGREVHCTGDQYDDFGRLLAWCSVGDVEVNGLLVSEGLAWAFTKYATEFIELEATAKQARKGIWEGTAEPAWFYRAKRWEVEAQQSPDGCPIKGNISKNGQIYHPPWSPWYSQTRIDTSKGERWFCDEAEAVAAGWRAPRWTR